MNIFLRFINGAIAAFQWAAAVVLALMMLLISCAVAARLLGSALPAQLELVELTMGTMVMLGLAYTEKVHGHITVGLLVDHWSARWQAAADMLGAALIFVACGIIGWVTLKVAVEYATTNPLSTDYLSIPLSPFKFIIGFGFWLWGLQAILRIPSILQNARDGRVSVATGGHA